MRLHISDRKWACIAAVCLLGVALFVVFVINPGGFEGQVGWFLFFLPGTFPAYMFLGLVHKLAPNAELPPKWMLMVLIVGFNFGWYWLISYGVIKIFRAGGWQLGSPDF
jgi:hypothetical protein